MEGVYTSKYLSTFINSLSFSGDKLKTELLVYNSFFLIKKQLRLCPIFLFFEVLEKIKPVFGLKLYGCRTKSKQIVAIPYILNKGLRYKKAVFWLSRAIKPSNKFKIFNEFYAVVFLNSGVSLKKKLQHYEYGSLYKKSKRFKW
jgi:ribosomal protein S7